MAYKVNDKRANIRQMTNYMLAKTLGMFRYRGLPDTIPARQLEKILQTHGYAFFTEIEGEYYALWGSLGGEPDVYGEPTKITIANPALSYSGMLDLNDDGVLIRNDSMTMGLSPLFERFHTLMTENQITMDLYSFNARMIKLLSASDDKTKESAELFLKRLKNGEVAVIGDNAMFDGIRTHNGSSGAGERITDLIEYQQYLKAALYHEIGLSEPANMKRERVNSQEVQQQEGGINTLVDNMLTNRKEALRKIGEKYGVRATVELAGEWSRRNEGNGNQGIVESR